MTRRPFLQSTFELAALLPIPIHALNREELAGRFPTRIRISKTRIAWLEREIIAWRENRQIAA